MNQALDNIKKKPSFEVHSNTMWPLTQCNYPNIVRRTEFASRPFPYRDLCLSDFRYDNMTIFIPFLCCRPAGWHGQTILLTTVKQDRRKGMCFALRSTKMSQSRRWPRGSFLRRWDVITAHQSKPVYDTSEDIFENIQNHSQCLPLEG